MEGLEFDLKEIVNEKESIQHIVTEGAASNVVIGDAFCNIAHGRPSRDMAVILLHAYQMYASCASMTCVDALSGCGLRALRLALEVNKLDS